MPISYEGSLTAAIVALATVITILWKRLLIIEAEAKDAYAKVLALEKENQRLIMQFSVLSSSHDSSPLPQWIKDERGVVLAVNRAYERMFLHPIGKVLTDYLHRKDDEIWPQDIAKIYQDNDNRVWRSRVTIDIMEPVPDANGNIVNWRIIKYPRFAAGIEDPIGIAGIAIPKDPIAS